MSNPATMKYLFLFSLLCLMACASDAVKEQQSSERNTQASPRQVAAKDTVKPKQDYIIIENPRPKSEIKAEFPFDIELKTAKGELIRSDELLAKGGHPTVLLFWLTTCYPCRLELAAIEKEFDQWQSETNFQLVAISTDFQKRYPDFVKRVNESNWPWESYNDHKREFRYILPGNLNGLPQVFVFNGRGEITYQKRRYESGDEQLLYEAIKQAAKS